MQPRTLLVLGLYPRALGVLFIKHERKDCISWVPKDEEGVSGREEGFSQCLYFSPSWGGTSLGEQEHAAGPGLPVKMRSRG